MFRRSNSRSVSGGHAVGAVSALLCSVFCTAGALGDPTLTWSQRKVDAPPGTRYGHAIAYDPVRRVVVLFGGWKGAGPLSDTWEWDGRQWEQKFPTVKPPEPRVFHMMAYDAANAGVLLHGGTNLTPGNQFDDTWVWNGVDWSKQDAKGTGGRGSAGMAFDSDRNVVVLFGGVNVATGQRLEDTWEWDGKIWKEHPVLGPGKRGGPGMVYDYRNRCMVLFGGGDGSVALADTWKGTWNPSELKFVWEQIHVPGPSKRLEFAMAYDACRGVALIFGGDGGPQGGQLGDTWEWNGREWSQLPAQKAPSRRTAPMTYDSARGVCVLFGGNAGGIQVNDTWEYGFLRGDMNCDGAVNNFDIDAFVNCLTTGSCGCH